MANSREPSVICLGAGKSQLLVIQKSKELGLAVLAVDQNPHAPGFALCNERLTLSTYEAQPIIERLRAFQTEYRFMGVINRSSGPPVISCAEICQAFGLPGVPPASAHSIVHKSRLMSACSSLGIAAPLCQSASSLSQIDRAKLVFPCIVKPSLSLVGKSGVCRVTDESCLAEAFAAARHASMNGMVNIEEYVPGYDVSLIALVKKGRIIPITLADELNEVDAKGNICGAGEVRGIGAAIPSILSGMPEEAMILALAQKIADSFRLDTSPFMMSCRCDFGGPPRLIELHLDLGGDLILEALMPACSSSDVPAFLIRTLMDESAFMSGSCQPLPGPVLAAPAFSPAAVIYGQGEGLVTDRPHTVLTAQDRSSLQRAIRAWRENERASAYA
ncbi:MAG: hypothetical protein AB1847_03690 [bacterium]